jgi:hypothetical protein
MRVVGKTVNERRRNSRPKLPPIRLRFDGKAYKTTEWTLGGFMVEPYTENHRAGNIIEVEIFIDTGNETINHTVEAMVARVDMQMGKLAAQFVDLEPEIVALLDSWMTGRLRRLMARKNREKEQPKKRAAR